MASNWPARIAGGAAGLANGLFGGGGGMVFLPILSRFGTLEQRRLQEPMKGRFTKTHLLRIHRFLFEDVYPFAGHIRREQISKGDTLFYPPEMIDRQLGRVFDEIHTKKLLSEQDSEKQIQNLSHVMTELNIIHPFREGNGRSIRELIRCMGLEYGLRLNWGNTDRDTLIDAAIASVDDDMAFCDVLTQCLETEE